MSDYAIKVENISKRYRIGLKEEMHDSLAGQIASFIKSPMSNYKRLQKLSKFDNNDEQEDVIWALRDIDFEVTHGEVLGIIGSNGAGKSTLLKILAQITEPTSGRIEINGRVASLLEVGTGFHPELTGRENVYLNGTILGMTKIEIDKKFDEIIDFSGIGKFIDTPVKRYSSGMRVRLAFSVAAFLEPEVLLIDEVLAVGDVEFQKKCIGKMGAIASEGRTILFVSHNMAAVSDLTEYCIFMHDGKIVRQGKTQDIVPLYLEHSIEKKTSRGFSKFENSIDKLCSFNWIKILNKTGEQTDAISEFEPFIIEVCVCVNEKIKSLQIGCGVSRLDMNVELFTAPSAEFKQSLKPGSYNFHLKLDPNYLRYGIYGTNLKLFANGLRQETIRQASKFTILKKLTTDNSAVYQRWVNGPLLFDYKWEKMELYENNDK